MSALTLVGGNTLQWSLKGDLTKSTLNTQYKALQGAFPQKTTAQDLWCIDLEQVAQADSAGLAFLIECFRYAHQAGFSVSIINAPQALNALGRIQGVATLLNLKG